MCFRNLLEKLHLCTAKPLNVTPTGNLLEKPHLCTAKLINVTPLRLFEDVGAYLPVELIHLGLFLLKFMFRKLSRKIQKKKEKVLQMVFLDTCI